MKKQQGFTLIELMIVVAVIGVLSAIAVPKYQEYVKKAAIGTALASVSAYKTDVEDTIASSGDFTSAANATFGIGTIEFNQEASSAGKIIATINEGSANGAKVTLARDSAGKWTCSHSLSASVSLTGC
ncbi:prepilin-type N-terminal cleavage/methylation domain-containing protein [Photobacterium sp. Alg240-V54]|uniref:pilin n=1 Tax=Photobacterium sp. Alg240-V54 TaxID=2305995 RepID=UPI0013D1E62A|nr:pilin [Photobacterium sp. Alg240-V54]